jgi:cytochrome c oxidase accessory protein FixG
MTRSEATAAGAAAPAGDDPENSVKVVSLYQATKKIYPRSVSGWFVRWRWALVLLTQLAFYGIPWLMWGERQAVLFDLAARRFYIFGLVLYPQDFIFLTGFLVISAYALFLFTTVAGRLWCGYACPQTVYTEIFLWVERKFEGDRAVRMKLDEGPWTFNKLWRKSGKQLVWVAIGLWTGFTLVGYFTPIQSLWAQSFTLDFGPWEWFWVLFYGFATYGNAGFMREQVCKYMCPYARFQSAMFDKDTLIISYDEARGEPRGSRGRSADVKQLGLGDCVNCGLCVQVCPTGIDIRKGLQYECIGCAACVDVCDGVMDRMGYERGLVRYATQNSMKNGWNKQQMWARVLRPRVLVYTGILGLITFGLLLALAMRSPFRVDVVRDRGALGRIVEDGQFENGYRLQIMNATERLQKYSIRVNGLNDASVIGAGEVTLGPAEARWVPLAVRVPVSTAEKAGAGAHTIHFDIVRIDTAGGAGVAVSEKSTFVIPR